MGGDCLNYGCVPSKALIRSARLAALMRRGPDFGVYAENVRVDFAQMMERIQRVIAEIAPHDSAERYRSLGVDTIEGEARITSPYTVEIEGRELTTRSIVVATGARPMVPPIPGLNTIDYLTSDTVWNLRELPDRLLVLDDDHWAVREGPLRHNAGLWRRTWVEATWAVAYAFKWCLPTAYTAGKLPAMKADMTTPRESIANVLRAEIPDFLSWAYGKGESSRSFSDDSLARYQRSHIATAYERFIETAEPDRYPFTDRACSPYDYRAFDLTGGADANAIVRIDIHT